MEDTQIIEDRRLEEAANAEKFRSKGNKNDERFNEIIKGKVKSYSELKALRKFEVKQECKRLEKKLHKDYFVIYTENDKSLSPARKESDLIQGFGYQAEPRFKTKNEMDRYRKQQLLHDLDVSCNYLQKTQYDRLKDREEAISCSPPKVMISIHEKVREENMRHFSEKYSKRPIGIHGKELPKFFDYKKDYWETSSRKNYNSCNCIKDAKELEDLKKWKYGGGINGIDSKSSDKVVGRAGLSNKNSEESYKKDSKWSSFLYNFMAKSEQKLKGDKAANTSTIRNKKASGMRTPVPYNDQKFPNIRDLSPGKRAFRTQGF